MESRQRDQRSSLEYQHGRCSAHGAWFNPSSNYDVVYEVNLGSLVRI